MKATNCQMRDLFDGKKQYVVPLFQRPYVWGFSQWSQLWSDITEQYHYRDLNSSSISERFLGSIVVVREQVETNCCTFDRLTIIDGQQRITTVAILLAVLRTFAKEKGYTKQLQGIQSILRQWDDSDKGRDLRDPYIVVPTHVDKASLYQIFGEDYAFDSDSKIIECFEFFWECLDRTSEYDLAVLFDVLMNDLCLVYIELRADENPNQIFEALNYRGVLLNEADLIRNLFFSRISPTEYAEETYNAYWRPVEKIFANRQDLISSFLHCFFVKKRLFIRKGGMFDQVRKEFHEAPSEEIVDLLRTLLSDATYYSYLVDPSTLAGDGSVWASIQKHLERLRFLGADAAYPYLLYCFSRMPALHVELFEDLPPANQDQPSPQSLSLTEFDAILTVIESYFVRRIICKKNQQHCDQLFYEMCEDAPMSRLSLIGVLSSLPSSYACPGDDEFLDALSGELWDEKGDNRVIWVIMTALEEFFRDNAQNMKHTERQRADGLVLAGFDDSYMLFEEHDNDFVVDHIMPLELTDWWRNHLGSFRSAIHRECVNLLGNLTLTIRNPLLVRADFEQKQRWYAEDHILMNKPVRQMRMWRRVQIEQRSQILSAFCLRIWPDIVNNLPAASHNQTDYESFRAGYIPNDLHLKSVVIRGKAMPVRYWHEVLERTVETLYACEERKFSRIPERFPHIFSKDPTYHKCVIGKWSYKSRLGRYQIRDLCLQMLPIVGWDENDWGLIFE